MQQLFAIKPKSTQNLNYNLTQINEFWKEIALRKTWNNRRALTICGMKDQYPQQEKQDHNFTLETRYLPKVIGSIVDHFLCSLYIYGKEIRIYSFRRDATLPFELSFLDRRICYLKSTGNYSVIRTNSVKGRNKL